MIREQTRKHPDNIQLAETENLCAVLLAFWQKEYVKKGKSSEKGNKDDQKAVMNND